MDARKGGSNGGTKLCGRNTHVVAATGDDNDLRAGCDNGANSGPLGSAAGFTRR
jgi:hypothetical protein